MKTKIKRIRKSFPRANREVLIPTVMGRPSIYNNETFPNIALSLLRNTGADNSLLGDILGVGPNTIKTWCRKHPDFKAAVRQGRDEYDTDKVETTLLNKALGYDYEEKTYERKLVGWKRDRETGEKIAITEMVLTKVNKKHQTGDTTSIIFWLKNRNLERWRDINRIEKTERFPDGAPGAITNNYQLNVQAFLDNASEDELQMLDNLSKRQPLIEAPSANSVSHG